MIEMLLAAGMAGVAAVLGTALPLWRKPSTLVSSVALGFAAGVMIGIVAFEMLPEALRIASLLVVALGFGLFSLYRGGDFARSHSNKLMRLRIVLQLVAVIILIAAFWWRSRGGL